MTDLYFCPTVREVESMASGGWTLDDIDPFDETEAEIDVAMAARESVELVDLPELTSEDAVEPMQDMATDLYQAQDRLAFIAEICAAAETGSAEA